ncbi:hypothetical protein KI387_006405, partial [Taxus chinensis]
GSVVKLQLLDTVEQSFKSGKKQAWHIGNITNICVGLLAALKASLVSRTMKSEAEVLQRLQSIFQGILAEEGICISQRRAAAEGLGLLARVGNEIFAARLTRSLIADATGVTDSHYKESIALSLGCIHRSAGGMALSVLIPITLRSLCMMVKDPKDLVRIWSLHGLCLTTEAGGLSCVPHVQTILSLTMDVLLYEEHPGIELRQNIGRLVNAIVAVLGPELSPGSSFFLTLQDILSSCKSTVINAFVAQLLSELVENVSEQNVMNCVVMIDEHIEEDLFSMLDMETDSMIAKIVRATIDRLLDAACPSCPLRWLQICRNVVLATSAKKGSNNGYLESETGHNNDFFGEDDEGMIVSSKKTEGSESIPSHLNKVDKPGQLPRYRTRVFAAECLSQLPNAVGTEPTHFDLLQARKEKMMHSLQTSGGDWLVLHLAELVALAYQISTGTFEKMRPLGVTLLSTIVDKFEKTEDPELPGHFLMEQYQAQLVSAVRTALDASAGPVLLDAGLQLATKILTSSIASGDRVVLERMFSMISRPLGDLEGISYPSFAEWVSCKVKIRLLAAHAAVKTYAYYCMKNGLNNTEYLSLVPLLLKNSTFLGCFWIGLLRDHLFLHTHILSKREYKPFLDGIQSAAIASVVHPYLTEVWPVILQAATLDATPEKFEHDISPVTHSSHIMVKLDTRDFYLLWGLAILILFEGRQEEKHEKLKQFSSSCTYSVNGKLAGEIPTHVSSQLVALYALQCLSNQGFYNQEMLSCKLCLELLQILMYPGYMDSPQTLTLLLSILEQVIKFSPDDYFMDESFFLTIAELCMRCIHKLFGSDNSVFPSYGDLIASSLQIAEILVCRLTSERRAQVTPILFYASYRHVLLASMGPSIPTVIAFMGNIAAILTTKCADKSCVDENSMDQIEILLGSLVQTIAQDCEQNFGKLHRQETSETYEDLSEKLTLLLGIMMTLARSVLGDEHTINENIWSSVHKSSINCLHKILVDSNVQVQLAGLHALRTILQIAAVESPKNNSLKLALVVMGELATDVFSLIQNSTQKFMTNEVAAVVGESLKLFLLLHALIEANECQQDVLNLLLQAIVMSSLVDTKENSQACAGLRSVAMKLVSHLANVPSSATQFRAVLIGMPDEMRQKLQDIIRASVAQDTTSVLAATLPVPLPAPKLAVQSAAAKADISSRSDSILFNSHMTKSDESLENVEDDDWDNFQSFPVSNTVISEDTNGHEIITEDLSKQGTDLRVLDWIKPS